MRVYKGVLIGDEKMHLGVMLIARFRVDIGPFAMTGFFRAMRRFSARSPFNIITDEYQKSYFPSDKKIFKLLVNTFKDEMTKLGHENFLRRLEN